MKIRKQRLKAIGNLQFSEVADTMDAEQFGKYCKSLEAFIETFPALEQQLKKHFDAKDADAFSKTFLEVFDILSAIRANSLAHNYFKLLSEVKTENYKTAELFLNEFLSALSALSIDIQMAQHKDEQGEQEEQDEQPTASSEKTEQQKAEQEEQKKKLILAVDDVSFMLNMLKTTLQNSPYKFTGVTSGIAALRFLNNHTPDLFILDIEMPEMDGYQLAEKIRGMGHTAPIIFLTGNATKEYVLKAVKAGAADFIVKPANKEDILKKVKKYIK